MAYEQARRKDPKDLGVIEAIVRLCLELNEPDTADELLSSVKRSTKLVRQLRSDVATAQVLQGIKTALENQTETEVRDAFQDLMVRFPDNPRVLHALGDTLMRYGKPDDAVDVYVRARELRPGDVWLGLAHATATIEAGRPQDARAILDDMNVPEDSAAAPQARQIRARAFRAEGDHLWQDLDQDLPAFEAYKQSLEIHVDPWTLHVLGGAVPRPSAAVAGARVLRCCGRARR